MFIAEAYRRALLTDVGEDLGLSHGILYRYAENKEALFELALVYAMDPGALTALTVPLPAPPKGRALELVRFKRARIVAGVDHPAVFDAAGLVTAASAQQGAFPGVPGHEPDEALAAAGARRVGRAMEPIRRLTPGSGSYPNEADYFEPRWQRSFWAANYPRLLEIKRAYDPAGVFRVHHGVGSEAPGLPDAP